MTSGIQYGRHCQATSLLSNSALHDDRRDSPACCRHVPTLCRGRFPTPFNRAVVTVPAGRPPSRRTDAPHRCAFTPPFCAPLHTARACYGYIPGCAPRIAATAYAALPGTALTHLQPAFNTAHHPQRLCLPSVQGGCGRRRW